MWTIAIAAAGLLTLTGAAPDFSYSRPKGPRQPMPALPDQPPTPPEVKFGSFRPHNEIDQFILARLQAARRRPRPLCDDWDFLRRSSLDLCGAIPAAEDVIEFLGWPEKDRRRKWIDHLLAQQQYADHWTVFWGDLLRERGNLRGVPANGFRKFIHTRLVQNWPFDRLVREMIAAAGESESNPAVAFVLGDEADPEALTVAVSQAFLGVQMQCAQCHDHPFDWWTQDDFRGMADFFAGTRRRLYRSEDVFIRGRRIDIPMFELTEQPRRAKGRFLTGATSSAGAGRAALADLVTRRDNPYFARNVVNRLWAKLMGAGLVNPVDALGPRNPASHPELLDWLACEFVASGYDLKHILRLIANSRTYQQTTNENVAKYHPPRPADGDTEDLVAGSLFDAMPLRRMTAEQLHDSILVATGRYLADDPRFEPTIQMVYPPRDGSFLKTFGATDRMTMLPRDPSGTIQQALALLNGDLINDVVRDHPAHPVRVWRTRGWSNPQVIDALFVQCLTRRPTPSEANWAVEFIGGGSDAARWEDLVWALLNTREFQFIR